MRYASDLENPPFTVKDYNRFGKILNNINNRLQFIGVAYSVNKNKNGEYIVNKHFMSNGLLQCKIEYRGNEADTLSYIKALYRGIALTY